MTQKGHDAALALERLYTRTKMERDVGVRFAIATTQDFDVAAVTKMVRKVWGSRVVIERYFGGHSAPELRASFLATLPDLSLSDLRDNVCDWAYQLRERVPEIYQVEPEPPADFYPTPRETAAPTDYDLCSTIPDPPLPLGHDWAVENIRALPGGWNQTPPAQGKKYGEGILVGHLDTGWAHHTELEHGALDLTRAGDFVGNDPEAKDPLDYHAPLQQPGHGVATGCVIVSRVQGQLKGVAPMARLVPFRCIRSVIIVCGREIARAIVAATDAGCHVISMSLGGAGSWPLWRAVQYAVQRNIIVAAAAGNCVHAVVWPAKYRDCIAVAGSNCNYGIWKKSSRGPEVDIAAPAEEVDCADREYASDQSHSEIRRKQGTSFAVAHVAGAAALWLAFHNRQHLLSTFPDSKLQYVFRQMLKSTANTPANWDRRNFGAGILDVNALLSAALPSAAQVTAPTPEQNYLDQVTDLLGQAETASQLHALFQTNDSEALKALAEQFGAEIIWKVCRRRRHPLTQPVDLRALMASEGSRTLREKAGLPT